MFAEVLGTIFMLLSIAVAAGLVGASKLVSRWWWRRERRVIR